MCIYFVCRWPKKGERHFFALQLQSYLSFGKRNKIDYELFVSI